MKMRGNTHSLEMGRIGVPLSFLTLLLGFLSILSAQFGRSFSLSSHEEFKSEYLVDHDYKSLSEAVESMPKTGISNFVMFYSASCGHCKNAFPAFSELGRVLKDESSVVKVGMVSVEKNMQLVQKYNIGHYPTFLLLSKDVKDNVVSYSDQRTVKSFLNFLMSFLKFSRDEQGNVVPPYPYTSEHHEIAAKIINAKSARDYDAVISEIEDKIQASGGTDSPYNESYTILLKTAKKLKTISSDSALSYLHNVLSRAKNLSKVIKENKVELSLASWKNREQLIHIIEKMIDIYNSEILDGIPTVDQRLGDTHDLTSEDI